ncbi:MAG: TIGR00282 family metallophosphoesterase [Patescibacteria group bacterium]|nr:TIGR00282 family metallophosphoesterase [Patescibacteria group bacterium]
MSFNSIQDTNQATILLFGDIVGKIGRRALLAKLPELKKRFNADLTIANVENLAHGRGITAKTLDELVEGGVDAFTSGHHVWENQQGAPLLSDTNWSNRLIRPANVDPSLQGKGFMTLDVKGEPVTIVNLQGRLFMSQEASSPFLAFDRIWKNINSLDPRVSSDSPEDDRERSAGDRGPIMIIDLHAEATSEKMAFGQYVDGRASLVYGTHTHVPTNDAKTLVNGTGYLTDIGMIGLKDSVIGFEKNSSIKRFLDLTEAPYELLDKGTAEVNGLALTINLDTRQVLDLIQIREFVDI